MKNNSNQFSVNEYVCVLPFSESTKLQLQKAQQQLLHKVDELPTTLPRGIVLFRCRALAVAEKSWLKLAEIELRKWNLSEINISGILPYPMHSFYAAIQEKEIIVQYIKQFKALEKRVLQLQLSTDTIIPLQHSMQAKNFMQAQKNITALQDMNFTVQLNDIWMLRSESEQWVGCNKFLINNNEYGMDYKTA